MLEKIKTFGMTIVAWIVTWLYFGVFIPIIAIFVGVTLPINVIWMSIQRKEMITPLDYFEDWCDVTEYVVDGIRDALWS